MQTVKLFPPKPFKAWIENLRKVKLNRSGPFLHVGELVQNSTYVDQ